MDLQTYIRDVPRRNRLAMALGGRSPDWLYQVATERGRSSADLAVAIERETARLGPEMVPRWSLRPDLWGPPPEAPSEQDEAT